MQNGARVVSYRGLIFNGWVVATSIHTAHGWSKGVRTLASHSTVKMSAADSLAPVGERDSGISIDGIRAASKRLQPHVHRTPVLTCSALNELAGGKELYFKCELFQKTGSFKARGACNAVLLTSPDCPDVVTHSSGNHAQALAWAAKARGLNAHIVMPSDAPPVKVASVRGYGATVTLCEPTTKGRKDTAAAIVAKLPNSKLIPSSDDVHVVCGQGTVGLELVEQVRELTNGSDLDAVIVPVGGGGLIGGVTTAVKAMCPGIRVIGAEPEEADDAYRSKLTGELCGHKGGELPDTVADGLRINLSDKTWPIVRDDVDEIVTVPEEEIKHWMRVIYERMKLVIEPSAAVGVAVLMSPTVRNRCFNTDGTPPRIGIVLCGGNVDVSKLQMLLVGED